MLTVGKTLRAEREKRGLSLKDVELATHIRILYLDAIEGDNYIVIPGEVFLKGFIRNYASFLMLDGSQMIELYRESQIISIPEAETHTPINPPKTENTFLTRYFIWLAIGLVAVVSIVYLGVTNDQWIFKILLL